MWRFFLLLFALCLRLNDGVEATSASVRSNLFFFNPKETIARSSGESLFSRSDRFIPENKASCTYLSPARGTVCVARALHGDIWVWEKSQWSKVNLLKREITGPLSCTRSDKKYLLCFGRSQNGSILQTEEKAMTSWKDYKSIGGLAASDPTCAANHYDEVLCLYKGPDSIAYYTPIQEDMQPEWKPVNSTQIIGQPRCFTDFDYNVLCVALNATNNVLWTRWSPKRGMTGWNSLGKTKMAVTPSCVWTGLGGTMYCFGRGLNSFLFTATRQDGEWKDWVAHTNTVTSNIECVGAREQYAACFYVSEKMKMKSWFHVEGQWSLTGSPYRLRYLEEPACAAYNGTSNKVICMARATPDLSVVIKDKVA